jgi:hypothetical protein
MSRKMVLTFDEHDYDQLLLLAKLHKCSVTELVRRIIRAHLDKRELELK